jgi:hypothetical protein
VGKGSNVSGTVFGGSCEIFKSKEERTRGGS